MLVLAVLKDGPQNPQAVRAEILQRSHGQFDLSDDTVNPTLRRLEHLGLLASYGSVVDGSHQRTYKLTPAGAGRFNTEHADWQKLAAAVTKILDPGPYEPVDRADQP
jgi:PadR family transcriptional regulator PadR